MNERTYAKTCAYVRSINNYIMNINNFLKRIGLTKVELARELNLSRPTLNQYIELYESDHKIENERYAIIFNRLFSDDEITREQFDRLMDSVKFLLERDRKYDIGNLKPEDADLVARIHNRLISDITNNEDGDDGSSVGKAQSSAKVYDTILLLLNNYHSNTIMRELAGYFSDLNTDSDLSRLSDESKAYYAYFYSFFHPIVDHAPKLDKVQFELFLKRREEIKKQKEQSRANKTKNIRDRMKKTIDEVEREFRKNGIDASEEEIVAEVIRKMKS